MTKKSLWWLVASILIAFAGWASVAKAWSELLTVQMLPAFIGQVGSIIIAWLGVSPLHGTGRTQVGNTPPRP